MQPESNMPWQQCQRTPSKQASSHAWFSCSLSVFGTKPFRSTHKRMLCMFCQRVVLRDTSCGMHVCTGPLPGFFLCNCPVCLEPSEPHVAPPCTYTFPPICSCTPLSVHPCFCQTLYTSTNACTCTAMRCHHPHACTPCVCSYMHNVLVHMYAHLVRALYSLH